MIGYIHSLQSFGTVDGPGTRYVVFLQGCNLRCAYCHNPDTWKITKDCEKLTVDEVLEKYLDIREYCKDGITVTGGEPLLQLAFVTELFEKAKKLGIHTCIDTSAGNFNPNSTVHMKNILKLMKYTDLVLLDMKHINDKEHRKLTGIGNSQVFAFAQILSDHNVDMWVRHVLVPGITLEDHYLLLLGKQLSQYNNVKGIEVLPYHTMGNYKYEEMGLEYKLKGVRNATEEEAKRARSIIIYAMNEQKKANLLEKTS
ncbi:MAG: pyruvate formate-lyase-activating protein [Mycoplasmatales bacterium]